MRLRRCFRASPRTRKVQAMRLRPTPMKCGIETRRRSALIEPPSDRRNRWEGRPRPRQARTTEDNLEGEQGPGRTGRRAPSKANAGTDCPAEQGLGGPIPRRYDTNGDAGNGGIARVADRRRSKVRGGKDARRRTSAAGEESPSRGMKLDAGRSPSGDQQGRRQKWSRTWGWPNHRMKVRKRIEPHDWQQDATSLRVIQRNKPTRS